MFRTDIINSLISKFNYDKYLEIGVYKPERNFNSINISYKVGVDPEPNAKARFCCTSDEFFKTNTNSFDIIFIDGLHYSDQVYKDFENSLRFINPNGTIMFHDCNPSQRIHQEIPKKVVHWNGDCWKAWVKIRNEYPDLESFVIDTDEGCGIIKIWNKNFKKQNNVDVVLDYSDLEDNREQILNLVDVEWFKNWLKQSPKILL